MDRDAARDGASPRRVREPHGSLVHAEGPREVACRRKREPPSADLDHPTGPVYAVRRAERCVTRPAERHIVADRGDDAGEREHAARVAGNARTAGADGDRAGVGRRVAGDVPQGTAAGHAGSRDRQGFGTDGDDVGQLQRGTALDRDAARGGSGARRVREPQGSPVHADGAREIVCRPEHERAGAVFGDRARGTARSHEGIDRQRAGGGLEDEFLIGGRWLDPAGRAADRVTAVGAAGVEDATKACRAGGRDREVVSVERERFAVAGIRDLHRVGRHRPGLRLVAGERVVAVVGARCHGKGTGIRRQRGDRTVGTIRAVDRPVFADGGPAAEDAGHVKRIGGGDRGLAKYERALGTSSDRVKLHAARAAVPGNRRATGAQGRGEDRLRVRAPLEHDSNTAEREGCRIGEFGVVLRAVVENQSTVGGRRGARVGIRAA